MRLIRTASAFALEGVTLAELRVLWEALCGVDDLERDALCCLAQAEALERLVRSRQHEWPSRRRAGELRQEAAELRARHRLLGDIRRTLSAVIDS